jgi:transcriptional regulator with XRE-family HTH domain
MSARAASEPEFATVFSSRSVDPLKTGCYDASKQRPLPLQDGSPGWMSMMGPRPSEQGPGAGNTKPRNPVEYQKLLGERIRRLRRDRQLTQLDLARQVGVTNGQISTIERGLSAPSIGTLRKISEALDVPLIEFFESSRPRDVQVIRSNARQRITSPIGPEVVEVLAGTPDLHAVEVQLGPDQVCVRAAASHPSDLFLYVLGGQLQVDCQGTSSLIRTGDSLQTDGRYKLSVRNVGEMEALVLEIRSHNGRG